MTTFDIRSAEFLQPEAGYETTSEAEDSVFVLPDSPNLPHFEWAPELPTEDYRNRLADNRDNKDLPGLAGKWLTKAERRPIKAVVATGANAILGAGIVAAVTYRTVREGDSAEIALSIPVSMAVLSFYGLNIRRFIRNLPLSRAVTERERENFNAVFGSKDPTAE